MWTISHIVVAFRILQPLRLPDGTALRRHGRSRRGCRISISSTAFSAVVNLDLYSFSQLMEDTSRYYSVIFAISFRKFLLHCEVALTGDHDSLCSLRGTCAVHGLCAVSDSGCAKSQVLDESHDAETVFCGNSVYTTEIFVNILCPGTDPLSLSRTVR